MSVKENLQEILKKISEDVRLVAVSKTKPNELIIEVYNAGQRVFGENKAQELIAKHPELPKDIKWHFIGHLQTNKVKYITPFVSMIESVDRLKLLKEINKQAKKNERTVDCLLQFHIAEEEAKFGFSKEEAIQMLESESFQSFNNVRIAGVMGMATFTKNMNQVRNEFKVLKNIFDFFKEKYFKDNDEFKEISMGMSGDYQIAIEEGSTNVRIGTAIFGKRNL
ncbi:MAG: YggS family pyridoxal phosphate-dependent enzyme [Bacteroidales bacterium]|nr:YggS family pyridoxal phosphate-dependent enzyme [Bacteroidales bacterium]